MSLFQRFIEEHKKQYHIQAISKIQKFLIQTSQKISQRSVQFIKKLKDIDEDDALFDWTYQIKNPSISPICSKIMNESQVYSTFRCYDCMESVSSCICFQCFTNGDHKGHNYLQYQSVNGCCDCGNDQSWNSKGNCKSHGKGNLSKLQIEQSTQELYLKQFRLAFYIYFYFQQYRIINKYKQKYGKLLFQYLAKISQPNYQMKYLAYLLLSQPLSSQYKLASNSQQQTILHKIFIMEESNQLNMFVQLAFEIFPVEEFRVLILQEYFDKMRGRQQLFTRNHPLSSLNFQYLACVKLINKLIQKKQLKPFVIHPLEKLTHSNIPQAFKKYYEDLDYVHNMKSSKQYHFLHLSLSNICDLCFYRDFTKQKSLKISENALMEYNLDELFLKTFGHFVNSIQKEKRLIQKSLRELIDYISVAEINKISLAHQRAFAFLTLAYFDGNIYQLLSQTTCRNFAKIIQLGNIGNIATVLKNIIKNSLLTRISIQGKSDFVMEYSNQERYFLRCHPQQNFCQFLDIIFHKVMMMISHYHADYSQIIEQSFNKVKHKAQRFQLNSQSFFEYQNDDHKQEMLLILNKNIYIFLNFINTITRVKIDEIVIANYINLAKQTDIFNFYSRILTSFKQMNIKDFKHLALSVINSQASLQKFIKQCCIVQKGRIKCAEESEELQTFLYLEFFKKYQKKLTEIQPNFIKKRIRLQQFQGFIVFNSKTISSVMELCMNFLFKISSMKITNKITNLFSLICFEFFKIYLQDCTIKEKSFFQTLLQPSFRSLISNELLQQITIIQKNQELQNQRERIKDAKSTSDMKRKQKFLAKKKEKELQLRKNQQKILNTYEKDIEKYQVIQATSNICIYCKQTKNQQLNFISYIGLTNFYQQNLFKNDDYHIYFETCGHKIHLSCYEIVQQNKVSVYCFLCKRQTNILIPQLSQQKKIQINQNKVIDIITSFQAALINQREDIKAQIKQNDIFLNDPKINFFALLIQGLCKDILFLGLQDYECYKRTREIIHYQLFLLVKSINSNQIREILSQIKFVPNNKPGYILQYILYKFSEELLNANQVFTNEISTQEILSVNAFFSNFLKNNQQTPVNTINLLNTKQIFAELPKNLMDMSQYIGQCKICSNFTNYIYICLKCRWSCCRKCLNLMYKHSTYHHLDGSIFVSCTNGAIKFLHTGIIYEDDSIYENYLGEAFTQVKSHIETTKHSKFILNSSKLQTLYKIVLHYGIHQKIFLNYH